MAPAVRWVELPVEDLRDCPASLDDECTVRLASGDVATATYRRSLGGGTGFYDENGDALEVVAVAR